MGKRSMGNHLVAGRHWIGGAEDRRQAYVEITIDPDVIAKMFGHRALFNRTGQARLLHGGVIVKVHGEVTKTIKREGESS